MIEDNKSLGRDKQRVKNTLRNKDRKRERQKDRRRKAKGVRYTKKTEEDWKE